MKNIFITAVLLSLATSVSAKNPERNCDNPEKAKKTFDAACVGNMAARMPSRDLAYVQSKCEAISKKYERVIPNLAPTGCNYVHDLTMTEGIIQHYFKNR